MSLEQMEKLRAGICLHFFESLNVKGDLQLNYVEYDNGSKFHTAYGEIGTPEDSISIIFSMPNESDDVYMMVSDGDPSKLYGQLASIQQYNEEEAHVCIDHTVPTDNEYLRSVGWAAFVMLYPSTTFDDFEYTNVILDRKLRFCQVVPITEEERQLKMSNGIDALLSKFTDENRDVITFDQQNA
jgi:hypothetical protein